MDKYLQYKATDFAEDADFIKWVQSDFEEHSNKWDTFMNDNPSMGDEISEAIDIIELFQFEEKEVTTAQRDNLLTRIHSSIDADQVKEVPASSKEVPATSTPQKPQVTQSESSKSIIRYLIPIAAAACLGALVFFNMGGDSNGGTNTLAKNLITKTTKVSQTTSVTLPDASTVNLNVTSSLSFDENNFTTDRTLQLDGEAFFNVAKGKRFTVQTKNGSIEVVGTAFNVFARGNTFHVECQSGQVKVNTKSGQESVVLTANESCELTGKNLTKSKTTLKESDWVNGVYHFEAAPLSEVISELERQFKMEITTTPEVENKKYTGAFEVKDVKDALHAVTWPLGLEYTIDTAGNNGLKGVTFKVAQ